MCKEKILPCNNNEPIFIGIQFWIWYLPVVFNRRTRFFSLCVKNIKPKSGLNLFAKNLNVGTQQDGIWFLKVQWSTFHQKLHHSFTLMSLIESWKSKRTPGDVIAVNESCNNLVDVYGLVKCNVFYMFIYYTNALTCCISFSFFFSFF